MAQYRIIDAGNGLFFVRRKHWWFGWQYVDDSHRQTREAAEAAAIQHATTGTLSRERIVCRMKL